MKKSRKRNLKIGTVRDIRNVMSDCYGQWYCYRILEHDRWIHADLRICFEI